MPLWCPLAEPLPLPFRRLWCFTSRRHLRTRRPVNRLNIFLCRLCLGTELFALGIIYS